jgi:hypothetical protein
VTRRKLLTIGLLVLLAGVYLLEQGPQVLVPIAEGFGFVTYTQRVTPVIAPTLFEVPASNYMSLSETLSGSVQVQGSLDVSDGREIAFYIMDAGNFSEWRMGHPSAILIAKTLAITYNFTFTPKISGTYFFVFDNQDTTRRTVIFSLNTVEVLAVLSPIVEYAGYEAMLLGIVLSITGIKTGKKKPVQQKTLTEGLWNCRFCGVENASSDVFCTKCGRSQQ